ncbi:MAG: hypothetical protein ABEL97_02190 [Salinibacter sp.]
MTSRPRLLLLAAGLLLVGGLAGCDQGGVADRSRGQAPLVSGLVVRPDSVNAARVPPQQVQDSLAQIGLRLRVRATDPDGAIERVQFTIEPASNPQGTATGTLQRESDSLFARTLGLRVPVFRTEVYTVRVFAVDDDSLASNQVLGQFQFVSAP